MSQNEEGGGIREPKRDITGYVFQISAFPQHVTIECSFSVIH